MKEFSTIAELFIFKSSFCLIVFLSLYSCNSKNENLDLSNYHQNNHENLDSIKNNFKITYSHFNTKLQTDNRRLILNDLITSNEIVLASSSEISKKIDESENYYKWIKKTNDSLFSDLQSKLIRYRDSSANESEKTDIDKFIQFQLKTIEGNSYTTYLHELSIITEIRHISIIKALCKYEIKNANILFFDTKCLEDWKASMDRLNMLIQKSNLRRENLLKPNNY